MSNETEIAETETPVVYADFLENVLNFVECLPTKKDVDCTPEEREINDDLNLIIGFVEGLQMKDRDKTIPYDFLEREHWDFVRRQSEKSDVDNMGDFRF